MIEEGREKSGTEDKVVRGGGGRGGRRDEWSGIDKEHVLVLVEC